jgi:hypothetical protein
MVNAIIRGGGSGKRSGISYYTSVYKCPRKANLKEIHFDDVANPLAKNQNLQIGTLFHSFMELYYLRQLKSGQNPNIVKYIDSVGSALTPEEKALCEAKRLFVAYRKKFPASELGKIISVEETLPYNDSKVIKAVQEAVGSYPLPFTFKPDLIVRLDAEQAERIETVSNAILEPGYYLVDHKTDGRRTEYRQMKWENSLQMSAYQLAWNRCYPEKQLTGALVRVTYKLKDPLFETFYVPFPDYNKTQALHNFFDGVKKILEQLPDWANAGNCIGFYEPCYFKRIGVCNGY